jgi:hypothetical protein
MTNMFDNIEVEPDFSAISERYKNDPSEMVKALAHKEAHIQKLEAEAKVRSESFFEQLRTNNTQSTVQTPPSQPEPTSQPTPSVLDNVTLEQTLDKLLKEKAVKERQEQAKAEVSSTLLNTFGTPEKAKSEMALKARELGMPIEALDAIAINSPTAFYKLFGIEAQATRYVNTAPTTGNIRTGLSDPKPVDVQSEYRDILQKDRNKYNTQEVQNAIMAKAMKAAGLA